MLPEQVRMLRLGVGRMQEKLGKVVWGGRWGWEGPEGQARDKVTGVGGRRAASLWTGGPSGMNLGQHKASHGGAGRPDGRDSLR